MSTNTNNDDSYSRIYSTMLQLVDFAEVATTTIHQLLDVTTDDEVAAAIKNGQYVLDRWDRLHDKLTGILPDDEDEDEDEDDQDL